MREKQWVKFHRTPADVLRAAMKAWGAVAERESKENPFFGKVLNPQLAWARRTVAWAQETKGKGITSVAVYSDLDRDSLHCGVPYGRNFDKQRLIQSLVLNAAGDGLALTSKGKTAAELMVFARYVMFSEVYWHHAVRAATSMLSRAA